MSLQPLIPASKNIPSKTDLYIFPENWLIFYIFIPCIEQRKKQIISFSPKNRFKMHDYIFLIIAVVISIFAAVTKSKKKVSNNPFEKEEEKPRNSVMDQFLGHDFLEDDDDEVKFPEWKTPIMQKEPLVVSQLAKPEIFHQEFQTHLPERKNSKIQLSVKKQDAEVVIEPESEETPGYLDGFSLRRAFVYSEIMTRKYS